MRQLQRAGRKAGAARFMTSKEKEQEWRERETAALSQHNRESSLDWGQGEGAREGITPSLPLHDLPLTPDPFKSTQSTAGLALGGEQEFIIGCEETVTNGMKAIWHF